MILLLAVGCRPDPAPEDLEQLCAYLFEHIPDERDRELEDGVANLDEWLRATGIDGDGLEVDALPQDSVENLPGDRGHVAEGAVGAAVDDLITHPVLDVTDALLVVPQTEVFEDMYTSFEREFDGDLDCFMAQECSWIEAEPEFIAEYGGVITVETRMGVQYRWVDLGGELALVQRGWLSGDTVVSIDWASVEEQYYLMAILPRGERALRVQAIWIKAVLGDDAAPESAALNVMVNSMSSQSEEIQEYLDR